MSGERQSWQPAIANYAGRSLDERQQWYSPAATTYGRVRPGYSPALVAAVAASAGLTADSHILEVGCGPGLATQAFAHLGSTILALEPNPDFCQIAQAAFASSPRVTIQNTAFEKWSLQPSTFDAVLSATAWHWIPAEISYPKAAAALKPGGHLLLLWNKQLQPAAELYPALQPAYDRHAPHLFQYEPPAEQLAVMTELGQMAQAADGFGALQTGHEWQQVVYSVDDYLALLTTYSPYLVLAAETRAALLADLRARLQAVSGDRLTLDYLSAYQVVRKLS